MRWLTILLVLAMFAVAGCGGSDEKSSSGSGSSSTPESTPAAASGGGGENLALSADPGGALKFDKTSLDAKAGKVTITLDNPSDVPHAIEIEGNGVEEAGETVGKDGKSVATADLKAGTYDFYCPVGNHRAEGMEGKLTVN